MSNFDVAIMTLVESFKRQRGDATQAGRLAAVDRRVTDARSDFADASQRTTFVLGCIVDRLEAQSLFSEQEAEALRAVLAPEFLSPEQALAAMTDDAPAAAPTIDSEAAALASLVDADDGGDSNEIEDRS